MEPLCETEHIVLAVSQRRNTLTLFLKDQHYIFQERPELLSGANQTMLALTQYVKAMQNALTMLNWAALSRKIRASAIKDTPAQMKARTAEPHLLALPVFD